MPDVASSEVWIDVGAQLRAIRERAGYASPYELYRACGKPAQRTIEEIEAGKVKTLKTIDDYCEVLRVELPDVLRAVLAPVAPVDADALRIARAYQDAGHSPRASTLRGAMQEMAGLLEQIAAQGHGDHGPS